MMHDEVSGGRAIISTDMEIVQLYTYTHICLAIIFKYILLSIIFKRASMLLTPCQYLQ